MSIIDFFEVGSFDLLTTRAMSEAFDAACRELHDNDQPNSVCLIAERIIASAKTGERDPPRLCDAALQAAGITRQDGRPSLSHAGH